MNTHLGMTMNLPTLQMIQMQERVAFGVKYAATKQPSAAPSAKPPSTAGKTHFLCLVFF